MMDDRKMEIIAQLMEELQSEMEHSPDELGERLGRPKVKVAEMEMGGMGDDMEGEMPLEPESPEDKLKQRIMKLRG